MGKFNKLASEAGAAARRSCSPCQGKNVAQDSDGSKACRQAGELRPNGRVLCDAHWQLECLRSESIAEARTDSERWLAEHGLLRAEGETEDQHRLRLAEYRRQVLPAFTRRFSGKPAKADEVAL